MKNRNFRMTGAWLQQLRDSQFPVIIDEDGNIVELCHKCLEIDPDITCCGTRTDCPTHVSDEA